jgi:molybdopterin converting factor small subunit
MATSLHVLADDRSPASDATQLRVRVLLFASYAEALGASEIPLVLAAPATAADALAAVRAGVAGERLPPSPLLAVNERYAAAGHLLADGDVIAVIPPVAGG